MNNSFAERDLFWQEIKENKRDIFSCVCQGEKVRSSELECRVKTLVKDEHGERAEVVWQLGSKGIELRLRFRIFKDFPYLEYESFLTNQGSEDSGIVEDLNMLSLNGKLTGYYYGDLILKSWNASCAGSRLKVSYYLGSYSSSHDFIRIDRRLIPQHGENRVLLNAEKLGRSSERALPFFRMDFDDLHGFDIGVGWSGSWKADIELKCACALAAPFQLGNEWSLDSGMVHTRFHLKAGETVRAPGYFIGFRNGVSVGDFINIHRRFMLAYHAPRNSKGELLLPPLSVASWGGVEAENMKKVLQTVKEKQLPFEVHWIDAGWQGNDGPCPHFCDDTATERSDWPRRVGCNRINRYSHPNGLLEITDFARSCNLQTLVWFEPERYHKECGSPLFEEHPEWFLSNPSESYALDLGNPEAREWLTKWMLEFLDKEKIEHYRQDSNINLWESWRLHDAADRVGISEMKHIDGLYRFWSDLRKARPDMFIDNCSSGGRRLDYMLATYSFPLCQSDYETFQKYNYSCVHLENFYLNEVYPLHSTLSWMPDGDSYAILSGGCGLGIGSKRWQFPALYSGEEFDYGTFSRHLFAIREMRELLVKGNYYQLTKNPEDLSEFCAMQSHDRETEKGFVLVFRRPETEEEEFIALLPEIDRSAEYELRDFISGTKESVSGEEFRCFRKVMPEKRSVSLIFYQRKK